MIKNKMALDKLINIGEVVLIETNIPSCSSKYEMIAGKVKERNKRALILNPAISLRQLAEKVGYVRAYLCDETFFWLNEQEVGSRVDGEIPLDKIRGIVVYSGIRKDYPSYKTKEIFVQIANFSNS